MSDDDQQPPDTADDSAPDAPTDEPVLLTGDDDAWEYPELGVTLIREGEGESNEERQSEED